MGANNKEIYIFYIIFEMFSSLASDLCFQISFAQQN